MRKEFISYSILSIFIALLLFFETGILKDKQQDATKLVRVEPFEKLEIDLECDIYVSLGEEQKIVFEGPNRYLNKVRTTMQSGVLKISCEPPGMIARIFKNATYEPGSVKIYVKLTDAGQLIRPKKGNLISNEALQFTEDNRSQLLSLNANLAALLKLLGSQFGTFTFS
jgi:hypothetical protein